ncbi:MAG: hypothetical protein AAF533_16875 [Acidobacteriota bacterium]
MNTTPDGPVSPYEAPESAGTELERRRSASGEVVPWEDDARSWPVRLGATVGQMLLAPLRAFRALPRASAWLPLTYLGLFSVVGAWTWLLFLVGLDVPWTRWLPVGLVTVAGVLLVWILVGAVVHHFWLEMVGSGRRGFPVTLRVHCYAATVLLLLWIPLVGPRLIVLWGMVLHLLGTTVAHPTPLHRSLLAYFLYLLIWAAWSGLFLVLFCSGALGVLSAI